MASIITNFLTSFLPDDKEEKNEEEKNEEEKNVNERIPILEFEKKFTKIPNNGDGNCLFYALAQLMYGYENYIKNGEKIRDELCEFYKNIKNSQEYREYNKEYNNSNDPDKNTLQNLLFFDILANDHSKKTEKICKNKEWGDSTDIIAFCLLYKINIIVYQLNNNRGVSYYSPLIHKHYDNTPVYNLLFITEGHYEALIPKTQTHNNNNIFPLSSNEEHSIRQYNPNSNHSEPLDINTLLFNKFNFEKDNNNIIFSKTTLAEDPFEDIPKFDILQCSESMNCYNDTVEKKYKRLLLDIQPPSGNDDNNDIDLLLSIIKNEIKNKEEENIFHIQECYRIDAFLKNNIENYKIHDNITTNINNFVHKLFDKSNIELQYVKDYYIKI